MKEASPHRWFIFALLWLAAVPALCRAGVIVSGETYAAYDAAMADVDVLDAVGKITWSGGYASGTYLGDGWVLTAAHVAESATTFSFTINGTSYSSSTAYVHDEWNGEASDGNDIALIYLGDVNIDAPSVLLYSGTTQSLLGQVVCLSGYGKTGTGDTGATSSGGTLHAGENLLERTGGGMPFIDYSSSILLFDFDNPLARTDGYPWSSDTAFEYEYLIAPGDSGSGAFVYVDGQYRLAGINSFLLAFDGTVDADYGDIGGLTSVADYTGWIQTITGRDFTAVPEPATAALLAMGIPVLLRRRIKTRRQ